jgi:hypothetical protein
MRKGGGRKLAALQEGLNSQELYLGKHEDAVTERIKTLARERFVERLWAKDPTLWKTDPKTQDQIKENLGWLDVAEKMAIHVEDVYEFLAEVLSAGLKHAVLLGMGGEQSCPASLRADISGRGRRHVPHGP